MLPKFELGTIVATQGFLRMLALNDAVNAAVEMIERHRVGDWGSVDEDDAKVNEDALRHGGNIMSVYTVGGQKVWVITEADRSATTLLLPEEY